ncbi:cytochrome C5 [Schumannella luteola]
MSDSDLLAAIRDSGLLDSPEAQDGVVTGRAHLAAAVADVTVVVDPDDEPVDPAALVGAVSRILDITEADWTSIVDEVATEVEDAVGDEEVAEPVDLRTDLAISSITVLPDATLLSFAAPRQFPDSWISVQLDEELAVDDLSVDPISED